MVNFSFNIFAFISMIIFWMTMTGSQAWMMRSWFRIPIWSWIAINLAALLASWIVGLGIGFLLNELNTPVFFLAIAVFFGATTTISLIQWLVLRQQVIAPIFWSVANVLGGFFAWILLSILVFYLVSKIFPTGVNWLSLSNWAQLLLSIPTGAVVGVFSSTLINLFGRP